MNYRPSFNIAPGQKDTIINVVLPIVAGCVCYLHVFKNALPRLLINYLPDGLWAYAFFSCMLIIWQRQINFTWILITILAVAIFEWLQWQQIIGGTGDIFDLLMYLISGSIALFINKYLLLKFNSKIHPL